MKNRFLKFTCALCLVLVVFSAINFVPKKVVNAQKIDASEVVVTGESNISLKADVAKVSVSIFEFNENLENAKTISFDKYNKAKQLLISIGVNENDIVLNYFTTYAVYNTDRNIEGYNASLSFDYVVDIENIKISIDKLNEQEITNINNIDYKIKNYNDEYNKLLKSAIDNAVEKAKLMLNKQDVTIKKIIEQQTFNSCSMYRSTMESAVDNTFNSQVEITARVRVVVE